MLTFTSEIRDFGGAGTCVMCNGHKAREHDDKMVGRQRLIRLRRSIFLNFWASDLHFADHRPCCHTAHSSGFADDGFAVARQPQAGPRACSAGSSPHAGFTCQITRRTLPQSLKIIISHFPLRGKDMMRTRGAQRAWSLPLARRYSSASRVGVPKQTPPDRPVILGQILRGARPYHVIVIAAARRATLQRRRGRNRAGERERPNRG